MPTYSAKSIISSYRVYKDSEIVVKDNIIISIQPCSEPKYEVICPMLFDIHINGGYQHHFTAEPSLETIEDIAKASHDLGTFYTLPTIITSSLDNMLKGIEAVNRYIQENPNSGILGIHLEGPFLNPKKRGAHLEKYILKPTKAAINTLFEAGGDNIKLWTIAPEVFDEETLDYLLSKNVNLSLGHSDASYEEAQYAMDKGIKLVTHLYNAMSPMNHRAPGLVGAALNNEHAICQIILDGLHCHTKAADLALKMKKGNTIIVSDALFIGRKLKLFQWEEFDASLVNGSYYNTAGALAGSAISQVDAIKFAINQLSINPGDALTMASVLPFKTLSIPDEKWDISIGGHARFVAFDGILDFTFVGVH